MPKQQFDTTADVKAAKDHRCEYCGQLILINELHKKFVGMWDGDFQSWRMHNECFDVAGDTLCDGFSPYAGDRPLAAANVGI